MTAEQYRQLLHELAHVAGLSDSSAMLTQGRVKIGDLNALLVHAPDYDPRLLQVRLSLGSVPEDTRSAIAQALLEANYVEGYGGECVFSLRPETGDAVLTMRLKLESGLSAQELWQSLSNVAYHGTQMWESIRSQAQPSHGGFPPSFLSTAQV